MGCEGARVNFSQVSAYKYFGVQTLFNDYYGCYSLLQDKPFSLQSVGDLTLNIVCFCDEWDNNLQGILLLFFCISAELTRSKYRDDIIAIYNSIKGSTSL